MRLQERKELDVSKLGLVNVVAEQVVLAHEAETEICENDVSFRLSKLNAVSLLILQQL